MNKKSRKSKRKMPSPGGGRLGIDWATIRRGSMTLYEGTYDGAKASVWRANQVHTPKQFRTVSGENSVWVLRVK